MGNKFQKEKMLKYFQKSVEREKRQNIKTKSDW